MDGTRLARLGPVALLLLLAAAPPPARCQDRSSARQAYLAARGLEDEAARLEAFLNLGLEVRAPSWSAEDRAREARSLAFVLLVNGVTLEAALAVQDGGVDVIHAIAARTRPFGEQALLADVVVVADIVAQEDTAAPDDGFELSSYAVVQTRLKGRVERDTLVLRQSAVVSERNVIPETGGTYLLLLSRGMYRYRAAAAAGTGHGAPAAAGAAEDRFHLYRIYRIGDGRILWRNLTPEQTAQAFEEIRRLDALLEAYHAAR